MNSRSGSANQRRLTYHTAFENGTMDDATAGPSIRELRQRLTQLQARHTALQAT
jgi:site-specific DNA recombinase